MSNFFNPPDISYTISLLAHKRVLFLIYLTEILQYMKCTKSVLIYIVPHQIIFVFREEFVYYVRNNPNKHDYNI